MMCLGLWMIPRRHSLVHLLENLQPRDWGQVKVQHQHIHPAELFDGVDAPLAVPPLFEVPVPNPRVPEHLLDVVAILERQHPVVLGVGRRADGR